MLGRLGYGETDVLYRITRRTKRTSKVIYEAPSLYLIFKRIKKLKYPYDTHDTYRGIFSKTWTVGFRTYELDIIEGRFYRQGKEEGLFRRRWAKNKVKKIQAPKRGVRTETSIIKF